MIIATMSATSASAETQGDRKVTKAFQLAESYDWNKAEKIFDEVIANSKQTSAVAAAKIGKSYQLMMIGNDSSARRLSYEGYSFDKSSPYAALGAFVYANSTFHINNSIVEMCTFLNTRPYQSNPAFSPKWAKKIEGIMSSANCSAGQATIEANDRKLAAVVASSEYKAQVAANDAADAVELAETKRRDEAQQAEASAQRQQMLMGIISRNNDLLAEQRESQRVAEQRRYVPQSVAPVATTMPSSTARLGALPSDMGTPAQRSRWSSECQNQPNDGSIAAKSCVRLAQSFGTTPSSSAVGNAPGATYQASPQGGMAVGQESVRATMVQCVKMAPLEKALGLWEVQNNCGYRVIGSFCYDVSSAFACSRHQHGGFGPISPGGREGVSPPATSVARNNYHLKSCKYEEWNSGVCKFD
ncbi:hypothetical protein U1872_06050 [Sphingomonas sp. RB3P16]|uniref:hypothetical protein n=1 Tax=Parasphingomonas frigoris TaxID=3096163 RepID=UPI002FC6664C